MNSTNIFSKSIYMLTKHPVKVISRSFVIYAIFWTILEPLITLVTTINITGVQSYVLLIAICLFIGLIVSLPPTEVKISLKNTNTVVKILFGNIFNINGYKVIPVNEYFDSIIGDHVSPNSVHGKFINSIFNGQTEMFNQQVDEKLRSKEFEQVSRNSGRTKKYPIGTTITLEVNSIKYFLVALCQTNIQTLKASADMMQLCKALNGLWKKVRNQSGGTIVNLPLIGSGLSGVGLPAKQLLGIIIASLLEETKIQEVAREVRIVLLPEMYEEVNLKQLMEGWQ